MYGVRGIAHQSDTRFDVIHRVTLPQGKGETPVSWQHTAQASLNRSLQLCTKVRVFQASNSSTRLSCKDQTMEQ